MKLRVEDWKNGVGGCGLGLANLQVDESIVAMKGLRWLVDCRGSVYVYLLSRPDLAGTCNPSYYS